MPTGDRLTLQIERPAAGGRMIARHEGAIVFVSGAIPGETVEAVVEKVQRGTVWAVAKTITEPSPDRNRLPEGSDPACGGCVFSHVRYERQLELKSQIIADAFRRLGRITLEKPVEVAPSPQDGYRMRARLHFRNGRIGFFREGTHTLCDPAPTRQLRPDTIEALALLQSTLAARVDLGDTEIELAENVDASQRAFFYPGIAEIGMVSDTIRGATLERQARSFFQGNRFLIEPMVDHVLAAIAPGPIVDLYAGVGLFSLTAAAAGHSPVIAVEGDPNSAADLKRNAGQAGGAVEPIAKPVEEFVRRSPARPSTIIVDPPRTGMSREALDGAVQLRAPRFVYVSCDVATLARDAKLLMEAGYQIDQARAFDMFPNTAHIEMVISLSR